jgi:TonB family protein
MPAGSRFNAMLDETTIGYIDVTRSWMHSPRKHGRVALVLAGMVAIVLLRGPAQVCAQAGFVPAHYLSGDLPVTPPLVVSGGEVFLEVLVAMDGRVDSIRTLRTTPPFTDAVIKAVRGWRFKPATEVADPPTGQTAAPIKPVAGPVFVAAMFAPPVLLGPTLGQPPQDVLAASDDTPVPTVAKPAAYPPRALADGTVFVEVRIDEAGVVTDAQLKVSSPAFDATAIAAARSWSFRPARRRGSAVPTYAYLLFSFRQPVLGR